MEEYNKILWDVIGERTTASDRTRARVSFAEFGKMAAFEGRSGKSRGGSARWFSRVAFLMLIPLACLFIWFFSPGTDTPVWQEVSTQYGQTSQIVLADNTRINLNGGSTLVYPSSFKRGNRQVFFAGEGYFEVQADHRHPFVVLTKDASIQVLGTKFNLKSYAEDQMISVSLDEGKIAFEGAAQGLQKVGCEMVPGDNLSFDRETGTLKKSYSDSNSGLWRKGEYYFKNESLGNISRDIERIFGVRVVIEREELLDTHYHIALVNGETADDFVRILSLDRSLVVSRVGNTIVIR